MDGSLAPEPEPLQVKTELLHIPGDVHVTTCHLSANACNLEKVQDSQLFISPHTAYVTQLGSFLLLSLWWTPVWCLFSPLPSQVWNSILAILPLCAIGFLQLIHDWLGFNCLRFSHITLLLCFFSHWLLLFTDSEKEKGNERQKNIPIFLSYAPLFKTLLY